MCRFWMGSEGWWGMDGLWMGMVFDERMGRWYMDAFGI
jgi:hypothetical protein